MLKDLHVDQARYIARIANTARAQRDALLGNVAENDLDGPTPGRGERNPTAELGVDVLPFQASGGFARRNQLAVRAGAS